MVNVLFSGKEERSKNCICLFLQKQRLMSSVPVIIQSTTDLELKYKLKQ